MGTKLLYVEDFFKNSRLEVITCLKSWGNLSRLWSIINSLSKLSLAEDRQPLEQHFFLLPGVELERWMYPQPWTQGAFYKPQGWWNIYWPFTYLHAISKVLFNLTAAHCLDSHSQTPGSSPATACCLDLCSWTAGSSLAAACCADSHSTTPSTSLATACCADLCSTTPGTSHAAARWLCLLAFYQKQVPLLPPLVVLTRALPPCTRPDGQPQGDKQG